MGEDVASYWMWEPEHQIAQEVECPLCDRMVNLEEARRCNTCHRVVCLACFDVPMGICRECRKKVDADGTCPDYIA